MKSAILGLLLIAQPLLAQCKDVLEVAYNYLSLSSQTSAEANARQWFCSDNFLKQSRHFSARGSIAVLLGGAPASFGLSGSDQRSLTARNTFCGSSTSNFSHNQAISLLLQVVDPNVVAAWSSCVSKGRVIGLSKGPAAQTTVTVTATFNIISPSLRNAHPTIVAVVPVNATPLDGQWTIGAELIPGGLVQTFRVSPGTDASVILATTEGASEPLDLSLPPPPPPPETCTGPGHTVYAVDSTTHADPSGRDFYIDLDAGSDCRIFTVYAQGWAYANGTGKVGVQLKTSDGDEAEHWETASYNMRAGITRSFTVHRGQRLRIYVNAPNEGADYRGRYYKVTY